MLATKSLSGFEVTTDGPRWSGLSATVASTKLTLHPIGDQRASSSCCATDGQDAGRAQGRGASGQHSLGEVRGNAIYAGWQLWSLTCCNRANIA